MFPGKAPNTEQTTTPITIYYSQIQQDKAISPITIRHNHRCSNTISLKLVSKRGIGLCTTPLWTSRTLIQRLVWVRWGGQWINQWFRNRRMKKRYPARLLQTISLTHFNRGCSPIIPRIWKWLIQSYSRTKIKTSLSSIGFLLSSSEAKKKPLLSPSHHPPYPSRNRQTLIKLPSRKGNEKSWK